jgi:RecA/RadA recombinase
MAFLGLTALDDSSEFTRLMLFGQPSSGKTTCAAFLANLPGDGLTVFVDIEGGIKKDALRRQGVDTSKVVIWPDREKGEEVTYDSLEKLLYRLRSTLQRQPGAIKGTVFDSSTELGATLLLEITTWAFEKDQALPQVQKDKKLAEGKKLRESKHETQIQDYGTLTNQGRTIFRGFRDLGCHLVITALEKDDAEGENGAKAIGPELPNKLSASVRGYVDMVLRLTAETVKTGPNEHVTLVKADTKLSLTKLCKDRDGVLPMELLNPTFDRIRAYATGELTEETDPEIIRHQEIRNKAAAFRAARKQRPAA